MASRFLSSTSLKSSATKWIPPLSWWLKNIAQQLEKRTSFRRAMKNAIGRSMRPGAKGIKVMLAGRLNGEIARSDLSRKVPSPPQTLRADIDYGFCGSRYHLWVVSASRCGIYKGEVLSQTPAHHPRTIE